ncbi:hypothetical protein FIU00_03430 [Methylophilus medardicus]|uniref:Uncharacterized protein n=2 Tax=Methylophilus medardicus TaxID=2588534 RepID=A0A5B8CW29_9PROT|nr:hypothetical protein FIU01_03430 [Methylophilus medardicus]QDC50313.1 hypothetical protein FIU00_03430 [Methylophilus medardicus]QDC54018.1 hypothetical protein FIT99_03430 [Methylophilus medardicus]
MVHIRLDHWIQQVLDIWQKLSNFGPWQQDAFLLLVCLVACAMLFLTGTAIGLFLQSLWGIFVSSRTALDEHK